MKIKIIIIVLILSALTAAQNHFSFTEHTGNNATVAIPVSANPNIGGIPFEAGDEIGAFTPSGLCVGAAVWDGSNIALTVWGKNDIPAMPGITPGEEIFYRLWKQSVNKEYPVYSRTYSLGNGIYQNNGLHALSSLYATGVYIDMKDTSSVAGAIADIPLLFEKGGFENIQSIKGKFTYDTLKLQYLSAFYGEGTLINNNGWLALFKETVRGTIDFVCVGYTPLTTNGTIAKLNFWIIDGGANSTTITLSETDFTVNELERAAAVSSGFLTYGNPPSSPLTRGNTSLDEAVALNDAVLSLHNIYGFAPLTQQSLANADADLNGSLSLTDISYMLHYIKYQTWPAYSPNIIGSLNLSYPDVTFNDFGLIKIPVGISSAGNLSSLEIIFNFDPAVISFLNFTKDELLGSDVFVDAAKVAEGKVKYIFTSAELMSGNFSAGSLLLRFNSGIPPAGGTNITTSYKINNQASQQGGSIFLSLTDVDDAAAVSPAEFALEQNYPNPFNPTTRINFSVKEEGFYTLRVFNLLGQQVSEIFSGRVTAGSHSAEFSGDKLSSGTYIYELSSEKISLRNKMILIK